MTDTNYIQQRNVYDHVRGTMGRTASPRTCGSYHAEIEESEVFKYSPFKGLTTDQRVALDKILSAIDVGLEKSEPIVVEGMPGTGKTILAIHLLKALRDNRVTKT